MLTNNVFLSQAAPWPLLQTFICEDSHLSSYQILNSVIFHFGALLYKENTEANANAYVHFTSKPLPLPLPICLPSYTSNKNT